MENKVEIKIFLGMEVRVINNEFVVLKDMFDALGRLREDEQIQTTDRRKLEEFLSDIDKESAGKTFTITSKGKKHSRETQDLDCLKLETVPIVLTQFKPTARKGEESLSIWKNFMKFIDQILTSLEIDKYIFKDKERQKEHIEILVDDGGSPIVTNKQVNSIMAELIGVYDKGIKSIKKDELKIYKDQTTIDLLEVREFVLNNFINAYRFCQSHKVAKEMTLKLAKRKYNLNN